MLPFVFSQTPPRLCAVVTLLTRQHHGAMLRLFVCFEVTTVSRLVVAFVAEVHQRIRIVPLQVFIKSSICVACIFALVALEVLFIVVSGHVDFHVPFSSWVATCFVITLVTLEQETYVVLLSQVSFQRMRFFRFVRTHCANDFTSLVNPLVHDKFVFLLLGKSTGLKTTRGTLKLSGRTSWFGMSQLCVHR